MLDVGMKRVAATVSEIGYLSWTSRGHGHDVAPCRDLLMCHCRAAGTASCDMTTAYFRLAAHGCQGCALVGADSQRLLQRWFGQTVKMECLRQCVLLRSLEFHMSSPRGIKVAIVHEKIDEGLSQALHVEKLRGHLAADYPSLGSTRRGRHAANARNLSILIQKGWT